MDWNNCTIFQYVSLCGLCLQVQLYNLLFLVSLWEAGDISDCITRVFAAVTFSRQCFPILESGHYFTQYITEEDTSPPNQQVSVQTVTTSLFRLWVTTSRNSSLKVFSKSSFFKQ